MPGEAATPATTLGDHWRFSPSRGHRESRHLAPDAAGHRQAWRDFRAYCAARDTDTNLTSHGTPDGDNTIGFSSENNAAVLADTGTILANSASG